MDFYSPLFIILFRAWAPISGSQTQSLHRSQPEFHLNVKVNTDHTSDLRMPHTGNVLHPEFHRVLSFLKTFFSNLCCVEARRRCVRVHAESSCAPLVWWLWWCWGWVILYVEHRWECSPPQGRFFRLYTSILFTKIIFLERFRNVVQAIVNKTHTQKIRPSAERCTLQGVLFKFQDLCGEGGMDAEHLLLCGPPYGWPISDWKENP